MRYYSIQPEVAGGFGNHTILDSSIHPPIVSKLHYEFKGWLGDAVIESFPCFIVSQELASRLQDADTEGVEFDSVFVSKSPEYLDSKLDYMFPEWLWLKVIGEQGDDMYIDSSHTLVVSDRVLQIFKDCGLNNADIVEI